MKIVLASVLLHDIGRLYPKLGDNHHEAGAKIAPKYLKDAGFTDKEIEAIIHCIRAHGPRGLEEPKSLEAKVVYDIDALSCSVGYLGVARVFSYFMREEGLSVKETMMVPSGRKGPREDLAKKVCKRHGDSGKN
jgi:HD superfamily phosphodiesterase